jgi:hypothetical protein
MKIFIVQGIGSELSLVLHIGRIISLFCYFMKLFFLIPYVVKSAIKEICAELFYFKIIMELLICGLYLQFAYVF